MPNWEACRDISNHGADFPPWLMSLQADASFLPLLFLHAASNREGLHWQRRMVGGRVSLLFSKDRVSPTWYCHRGLFLAVY